MVLAHQASYNKKMLARQVILLALGYQTALSLRPESQAETEDQPIAMLDSRHPGW